MNEEQLLIIGLLGATAVAGAVTLSRHADIESPSVWYELIWPRETHADGVTAFLRHLAGDHRHHVLALEVVSHRGHLTYRLGIAERHSEAVLAALSSYLPGTVAKLVDHHVATAPGVAWRLALSSNHRPLRTRDVEHVARAITTALAVASTHNPIIYQWLLGPRLVPMKASTTDNTFSIGSWQTFLKHLAGSPPTLDSDNRRALQDKIGEAGFRCICRIGIAAQEPAIAQAVVAKVLAALRTAETPGVHISLKKDSADKLAQAQHPRRWPLALNVSELAGLDGWPLGDEHYPGVERSVSRLLSAPSAVARRGRVVAVSTVPGPERPLALRIQDSLQHLHVLGPTGVGKSTLLLNLIVQDMEAERGVIVVDPKGDLVEEVLKRVPEDRANDVVVLDPADEQRPVGLNVLAGGQRPAELIADQVLAVFHDLYRENWGPRTQDILHAALLTLAGQSGATLCALPVLLSNARFRRDIITQLDDEIALKPFWRWFDGLSEGERQQAIAPVMNKLRAFLLRPRMRAIIGQADSAFDLHSVFTERKVLLISLAKGLLGPEAAALLGSLIISQVWQAALGRVRVPVKKRAPVMVYIDEFQDYLHLPTDVGDVLAQARGLGVGLTLAHQHLAQLPTHLRSAVLANARSRVCFQLGSEDARLIAAQYQEVDASDLQNLDRFEAYVSLVANSKVMPFASGRTLAPIAAQSSAVNIRAHSRMNYGRELSAVEGELAALVRGSTSDDRPIGKRRRS